MPKLRRKDGRLDMKDTIYFILSVSIVVIAFLVEFKVFFEVLNAAAKYIGIRLMKEDAIKLSILVCLFTFARAVYIHLSK